MINLRISILSILLLSVPNLIFVNDVKSEPGRCHFSKCFVSVIHLATQPMLYHEKTVVVIGVFSTANKKTSAVYLDLASKEHFIDVNGLYIRFGDEFEKRFSLLDSKYGLIEGVFDASDLGPTNRFIGTLKKIKRILPWPPSESP